MSAYLSVVLLRRIIATAPAAATSSISATKVAELSEVEGVSDSPSEEAAGAEDSSVDAVDSSSEDVAAAFTVIVQVASTSPFFTVMVTSPALSAETSPSLTVAIV